VADLWAKCRPGVGAIKDAAAGVRFTRKRYASMGGDYCIVDRAQQPPPKLPFIRLNEQCVGLEFEAHDAYRTLFLMQAFGFVIALPDL